MFTIEIEKSVNFAACFLNRLENPKLEGEVLLAHILNQDRVFIKTNSKKPLYIEVFLKYLWWVLRRRCGVPVAHIVGYKKWGDMKLLINQYVLIPRDETEVLCDMIYQEPRDFYPRSILDVGTGSGAISLYLSREFLLSYVLGIDISGKALVIARKNAEKYAPYRVKFLVSDLLSKIESGSSFDMIVANLPYIPEKMDLSIEVRKDPTLALFSGDDGLHHYRRFAKELQEKNISFRELWIEFLPSQQIEIKAIFSNWEVDFRKDLSEQVFYAKIQYF